MIMTQYPDLLTLAIGDGPNDLGMIYNAKVGLGIYTPKSARMRKIPHYAVTGFCTLPRLLLSNGTEALRKTSLALLGTFYMTVILVMYILFLMLF